MLSGAHVHCIQDNRKKRRKSTTYGHGDTKAAVA